MRRAAGLIVASLFMSHAAFAADMDGMKMSSATGDAPSSRAYMDAMGRMHAQMDIDYTGNPDVDFVNGMLPHHQGAVDMAKVELQYGTDPAIRKLAADIVAAQEKEIRFMKAWQAKHASGQ